MAAKRVEHSLSDCWTSPSINRVRINQATLFFRVAGAWSGASEAWRWKRPGQVEEPPGPGVTDPRGSPGSSRREKAAPRWSTDGAAHPRQGWRGREEAPLPAPAPPLQQGTDEFPQVASPAEPWRTRQETPRHPPTRPSRAVARGEGGASTGTSALPSRTAWATGGSPHPARARSSLSCPRAPGGPGRVRLGHRSFPKCPVPRTRVCKCLQGGADAATVLVRVRPTRELGVTGKAAISELEMSA